MRNLLNVIIVFILLLFTVYNCSNDTINKDESVLSNNNPNYLASGELEIESKEIIRNGVLEMTELTKIIKTNYPLAYQELFELLKSRFYVEPYVGLHELIDPNSAIIYLETEINSSIVGSFKQAFEIEVNEKSGRFPNLEYISLRRPNLNNQMRSTSNPEDFDLDFYDAATIAFYAPYIEDLNDIEFDIEDNLTVVPGVIDADTGLGYKQLSNDSWVNITVNDDYAENNFTLIVEPNNFDSCGNSTFLSAQISDEFPDALQNYQPCFVADGGIGGNGGTTTQSNTYNGECSKLVGFGNEYVRQVFVGHSVLKKQYDKLISFTGNGGGSEIIIARVGSREYLEYTNDGNDVVVNNFSDQLQKYYSRKDIRKKRSKWIGALWDPNWECSEPIHEQLFVVYEDDNTSPIDLDFSGIEWGDETYGAVDLEYEVRTKDEIIRIIERESTEFFLTNLLDQGCDCKDGLNSFSDRCWAWYDCGTNFKYTMPHRWVQIN